jgi:hypothetical protein
MDRFSIRLHFLHSFPDPGEFGTERAYEECGDFQRITFARVLE